jgi:hypothetical protein
MWRATTCAASGILLACVAAYGVTALGQQPRAAIFDLSRLYASPKGDRLPLSSAPAGHDAMAFHVPSAATTVAVRTQRANWIAERGVWDHGTLDDTDATALEGGIDAGVIGPLELAPPRIQESAVDIPPSNPRVQDNRVREVSGEDLREEEAAKARNLPEGCEPSFSPVTVPAMAHIAGRCLS